MKKAICIICLSAAVVLGAFSIAENQFAEERLDFKVENQSIDYSFAQLHFYNSLKDEYDATADYLEKKTAVIAADSDSKITFATKHKPLRFYELNPGDEKNERLKISYNKQDKRYELSPLSDNEDCEYNVVADYGFRKNIYSFSVFNKTYIEKRYNSQPDAAISESKIQMQTVENDVTVEAENLCRADYINFGFNVTNHLAEPISCGMFKLEKQMNGVWYEVEEQDVTYNQAFWDDYASQYPISVKASETIQHKFPTSPAVFFNMHTGNDVKCGVYRIVLPYTHNGEEKYAISNPFNVGYVPAK